jgi:hypothetical protein
LVGALCSICVVILGRIFLSDNVSIVGVLGIFFVIISCFALEVFVDRRRCRSSAANSNNKLVPPVEENILRRNVLPAQRDATENFVEYSNSNMNVNQIARQNLDLDIFRARFEKFKKKIIAKFELILTWGRISKFGSGFQNRSQNVQIGSRCIAKSKCFLFIAEFCVNTEVGEVSDDVEAPRESFFEIEDSSELPLISETIDQTKRFIFPEKKSKESAVDKMIFKHPHITVSILFGMIAVKTLFICVITPPGLRYPLASLQSSQHVSLGAHDHYDFPIDMVYLWAGDISEAQALVDDKIFDIINK